jgi:hypothetical protein
LAFLGGPKIVILDEVGYFLFMFYDEIELKKDFELKISLHQEWILVTSITYHDIL